MSNEIDDQVKSSEVAKSSEESKLTQAKLYEASYPSDANKGAQVQAKDSAPANPAVAHSDASTQSAALVQQALAHALSGSSAVGMSELLAAAQLDPNVRNDPRFHAAMAAAQKKQQADSTQS